jgi:signal transduction histidine kinase/ActR/RegA family two-component response regulator
LLTSRPALPALAVFVLLAAPFKWVVGFFEQREAEVARQSVQSTALLSASKLESFVDVRIRNLRVFANFIEPASLSQSSFESAAQAMYWALPGLQAINWIAPDGKIAWLYPLEENLAAQGKNVLDHPVASGSFKRALAQQKTEVPPPLELFQGKPGFASYTPVLDESTGDTPAVIGVVNGVFSMAAVVDDALEPNMLANFIVQISDGPVQLYSSHSSSETADLNAQDLRLGASASVPVHSREWTLSLRPTAQNWVLRQHSVFEAVAFAGLSFIAAIAFVVYLILSRRRNARDVQREQERMRRSLEEAQKMEAVGRLAGSVAHDFNNLLTTIVGNASLIETSEGLSALDRNHVAQVLAACDRATGLTAQLLAFSAHDSVEREQIQVCSEFQILLPLLRAMTPEGIELDYRCECVDEWVAWAPSQLAQVMTNLVSNAVDAQEGSGRIGISIFTLDELEHIQIQVSDQGAGMSAATLLRAKEPFYSTKGAGQGTGLGLASVARIVRECGGEFTLTSELGKGTTAIIEVPRIAAPAVATEECTSSNPDRGRLRVLVVEDKQAVREVTESLLQDLGHEVLAQASPAQALTTWETNQAFDLVMTDLQMPGMTGLELIEALRERGLTAPVILCSGYAENVRPERLRELNTTYLMKPFGRAALERTIATCFTEPKDGLIELAHS